MRDPNRINIVLDKVAKLWKLVPDWRLGQLIDNAALMGFKQKNGFTPPSDLETGYRSGYVFACEEDTLETGLDILIEEYEDGQGTNRS